MAGGPAWAGPRELYALRWIGLDLAEGTLTVNQQIAHARGHPYLDAPEVGGPTLVKWIRS